MKTSTTFSAAEASANPPAPSSTASELPRQKGTDPVATGSSLAEPKRAFDVFQVSNDELYFSSFFAFCLKHEGFLAFVDAVVLDIGFVGLQSKIRRLLFVLFAFFLATSFLFCFTTDSLRDKESFYLSFENS